MPFLSLRPRLFSQERQIDPRSRVMLPPLSLSRSVARTPFSVARLLPASDGLCSQARGERVCHGVVFTRMIIKEEVIRSSISTGACVSLPHTPTRTATIRLHMPLLHHTVQVCLHLCPLSRLRLMCLLSWLTHFSRSQSTLVASSASAAEVKACIHTADKRLPRHSTQKRASSYTSRPLADCFCHGFHPLFSLVA